MANFETLYNPLVLAGLTDKKPNVSLSFESGYKYLKAVGIQPKDLSAPYLITTTISLNAGEEILFVYKGAISPNIYAVSKVTINGTEKEYKGLVRTDQGVFVANQECYISYAAPEAMLVSLCYFKGSGDNTLSMVAYVTQNRLALFSGQLGEGIVYDKPDSEADISTLFDRVGVTYVIRYAHTSTSPVSIPEGCTLDFRGGNLRGIQSLTFNGTLLKGAVDLRTSLITENSTIRNLTFNADWVCPENKDSVDCTPYVQCIIDAFPHVIFPEGDFLFSQSKNNNAVPDSERFLLKLRNDNRWIEGEPGGANLRTGQMAGLLYVGNSSNVVTNIRIQGLTFTCENTESSVNGVEHLHTIGLYGAKDATISGCRLNGYYGDAIFLAFHHSNIQNNHVRIVDNHIDGREQHNRNGISIDDGTNIYICNNHFEKTSQYSGSVAAIDIEPPGILYHVDGVTIISNHFCNCGKDGAIAFVSEYCDNNNMSISNVRILNNEISNCSKGIFIHNKCNTSPDTSNTGHFIIRGNITVGTTDPFFIANSPKRSCKWIITENIFEKSDSEILSVINNNIIVNDLIVLNNM